MSLKPFVSRISRWLGAASLICVATLAHAQQEIRIGVIYPLTGAAASTGAELKNALELAADIVNNGAQGVPGLPFSKGGGLPGLKGAKIKLVFANDNAKARPEDAMAARILNFMDPDNGTTSAVLADRMHISGAKADELLTKMERQGLDRKSVV